ncbi:hypothetical protein [Microlunatus parietis]|uniref:Uncharacterized protein n=1 Tax=Microlunatus parietis TaxID=682979 RepID=A0A7Y9L6H7_9ACTN|nr:hypothetical protein [Microlunatus parietis]NYE68789.1 hypothetical protein [Microlunatus parietis]
MSDLAPDRSAASFDSATALQAALAAALNGSGFPHLGQPASAARAIRAAAWLPWPLLRRLYSRLGASEGVRPDDLGRVDLAGVAEWLAGRLPRRRVPAVMIGSSNGALVHLAAALQVPWLPGTVLVPVRRTGDPDRPDDALRFGERVAPPLLERNPDIVLHQMHDQVQDELMVAEMAYFRVKWQRLPEAYARRLAETLAPGAPVIMIEDGSAWPVVRVGERHLFQAGAQGGLDPAGNLDRPHTPTPDGVAAEAEWGAAPALTDAVAAWCADHDHPLIRLRYESPQAPSHAVATIFRDWYRERGERADRLVVPSFAVGDPWRMISSGSVPYWAFFSVRSALVALDDHLARSDPYREIAVLPFQHGVWSAGIATPEDWARVGHAHGAEVTFPGLRRSAFPHDIGYLGRYGDALRRLPPAKEPWRPLPVPQALAGLREDPAMIIRQAPRPAAGRPGSAPTGSRT